MDKKIEEARNRTIESHTEKLFKLRELKESVVVSVISISLILALIFPNFFIKFNTKANNQIQEISITSFRFLVFFLMLMPHNQNKRIR